MNDRKQMRTAYQDMMKDTSLSIPDRTFMMMQLEQMELDAAIRSLKHDPNGFTSLEFDRAFPLVFNGRGQRIGRLFGHKNQRLWFFDLGLNNPDYEENVY